MPMWRGDLQSLMLTALLLYAYSGNKTRAVMYYYFFRRRLRLSDEEMEEILEGWTLLCRDEGTSPNSTQPPVYGVHFDAFKWASLYRLSEWITQCNRLGVAPPARLVVSQYIHFWYHVPRIGKAKKHLEQIQTPNGLKHFLRVFREIFHKKSAVMPLSTPMPPEAISTKVARQQKNVIPLLRLSCDRHSPPTQHK